MIHNDLHEGRKLIISFKMPDEKPNRKKEFFLNTVLVISSLVFTFLVLEFGMRFAVRYLVSGERQERYRSYLEAKNAKFEPHPFLSYALVKNYISKTGENKHNSFGLRGEEIAMPKPEGAFRIITLGGSTTYGTAVENWKEAYPAQMEKTLRETYGYKNVEVINGGTGGYTSAELLINFAFNLIELDPDMIIFSEAVNDTQTRFVCPDDFKSDYTGTRESWNKPKYFFLYKSLVAQFIGYKTGLLPYPNLDQFIATSAVEMARETTYIDPDQPDHNLCNKTRNEIIKENTSQYYERNIRNLIALAEANGIRVVLGTFGFDKTRGKGHYSITKPYMDAISENNDIIRKIGKEKNIPIVPFEEKVDEGYIPPTKEYWQNVHLTAPGEKLKGELFAKFLAENKLIK